VLIRSRSIEPGRRAVPNKDTGAQKIDGAAMKHPSVRELYDYWNARRGLRTAPERAEIDPGAIRRVLADTFVLTFDPAAEHPFRIAGTRVCAAFGRELKAVAFIDMWKEESQQLMRDCLHVVAHESVALIAGARGESAQGCKLDFELLVLPLRHRARIDARILGALAPCEQPYWLGARALGRLSLGAIRYLGGGDRSLRPVLRSVSARPIGRVRHGFVVYDGGQV